MTPNRLFPGSLLVAVLLLVAGCDAGDASSPAERSPDDPEVAAPPIPTDEGDRESLRAVSEYRLTREGVARFAEASGNLRRMAQRDPEPLQRLEARETASPSRSLDETAERLESEPEIRTALSSAGLSAREYTLLTVTLSQSIFAHQALAQGAIDSLPPGVSEENVAFVREHQAEIDRLMTDASRDEEDTSPR